MDAEVLKTISPLVGGGFALAAAILSFVTSRLKDADDAAARANIYRHTLEWVSLIFSVSGMALAGLTKNYVFASVFFLIGFALQATLFLSDRRPLERSDVVVFSLITSVTLSGVVLFAVLALMQEFSLILSRVIEVQKILGK
jgi:hypothetical protein